MMLQGWQKRTMRDKEIRVAFSIFSLSNGNAVSEQKLCPTMIHDDSLVMAIQVSEQLQLSDAIQLSNPASRQNNTPFDQYFDQSTYGL